jgi:hypothetical protein
MKNTLQNASTLLNQPKDSGKPVMTPQGEDLKANDENFRKVLRTVSVEKCDKSKK